jgi:methanogenic corrinoid protein MtbC1
LYSEQDQNRVRLMQANLADGLAAAQAARAAMAQEQQESLAADLQASGDAGEGRGAVTQAPRASLAEAAEVFRQSLDALDEPAAQFVLDRLLRDFTVEKVLRDVVMPYLFELGTRWESGAASIAQEHFASHVVRGRLASLARGWGDGGGPQVLLACPPDEQHELALLAFGIVLSRHGWRVGYLGPNTPMPETIQVAGQSGPDLVVLAASTPERFSAVSAALSRLADLAPLVLAGAGASPELAESVGARVIGGDPVTAAEQVAADESWRLR